MSAADLINDARNYAVTLTSNSQTALNTAINVISQVGQGYVAGTSPRVDIKPPQPFNPADVPVYDGSTFTGRTFSGREPTLNDPGGYSSPPSPGAAPSVPTFNDPVQYRPTGNADTSLLNGVPIVNTDVDFPAPPTIDVDGIAPPVLIDVDIPDAPVFREPEFLGVRPSFTAEAPTDLDVTMRQQYQTISPVMQDAVNQQIDAFLDREFPEFRNAMAAIESRLNTYLQGGTALTPAVENAIYNRTLDKNDVDARRAAAEAWTKAAKAGWSMPTALLLAQQADIDKARRDSNARAATEIAIKQAELEQQNLQFAVTQSINLRKVAIDAAMAYYSGLVQINGQALDYARSVVDAIVKSYDIAVKEAEIKARLYEVDARVYDSRLKGAIAIIEAYEAQIRGELAKVEVNKAQVDVYRAQLDAVKIEAEVYKIQVEAAEAQINIEKAKVDLYRAKVDAFVAQVNGFSAQWNGYVAAVSGERAKIEAAGEQVKAYGARVQAFEAEVRAKATEIEAKLSINTQRLASYKAQVEAYSALVNAEARGVEAEVNSFQASVQAYKAQADAEAAQAASELAVYEVALRGIQEAARLNFEYTKHRESVDMAKAEAIGRIAASIGQVYAETAQASLAGMNSLAAETLTQTA
jgi:hypothetical protein